MSVRAYLDNNATTRLAEEALDSMLPYLRDLYFNPSSAAGELSGVRAPLEDAARALAALFGHRDLADGFRLTSGASEANSWVIHSALTDQPGAHVVATAIEHPSALMALESWRRRGAVVTLVPPDRDGRVSVDAFVGHVRKDTRLVLIMAANNETGVIQPVREVADGVRRVAPTALVHVDATQAVGRIPVNLAEEWVEVDSLSLSAHKFHGPKGIGALFVREWVGLLPLIHGSGDGGRRGGTSSPAAAAGLATGARLAVDTLGSMERVCRLRDLFEHRVLEALPRASVNGAAAKRLPNTSSLVLHGVDANAVVDEMATRGICVAAGAACTNGSTAPSHVLVAMGLTHEAAKASVRVSLSRDTTIDEVELAAQEIISLVRGNP